MAKIVHEKDKCIGCGACVSLCPKYWEMGEDGKAALKNAVNSGGEKHNLELEKVGCNRDAAESCPTQCILVLE